MAQAGLSIEHSYHKLQSAGIYKFEPSYPILANLKIGIFLGFL